MWLEYKWIKLAIHVKTSEESPSFEMQVEKEIWSEMCLYVYDWKAITINAVHSMNMIIMLLLKNWDTTHVEKMKEKKHQ